jgi:hypothetical protein
MKHIGRISRSRSLAATEEDKQQRHAYGEAASTWQDRDPSHGVHAISPRY